MTVSINVLFVSADASIKSCESSNSKQSSILDSSIKTDIASDHLPYIVDIEI